MIKWLKEKIFGVSNTVIKAVTPRTIVSATYNTQSSSGEGKNMDILTIDYSDGSSYKYEGSCTVWHTYPMFNRCGTTKDGELYEIWKYIQHHGNPYPNAHELNIVKETAKKFNI